MRAAYQRSTVDTQDEWHGSRRADATKYVAAWPECDSGATAALAASRRLVEQR